LDGWRAFAVALVLLDHAADAIVIFLRKFGVALPFVDHTFKEHLGRAGVHIFFSLSGYLITLRMLQEESSSGAVSLRNFYTRRLFRIQPAALVYLAVVACLGLAQVVRISPVHWLSALLCYANFSAASATWYTGHFWSLSIEEHFYLLWPALFVSAAPWLRLRASLVLAVALSVWMFLLMKFQWNLSYVAVRTDFEAQWLVWGCVAALCSRSELGTRVMRHLAHPISLCIPLTIPVLPRVGTTHRLETPAPDALRVCRVHATPVCHHVCARRWRVGAVAGAPAVPLDRTPLLQPLFMADAVSGVGVSGRAPHGNPADLPVELGSEPGCGLPESLPRRATDDPPRTPLQCQVAAARVHMHRDHQSAACSIVSALDVGIL